MLNRYYFLPLLFILVCFSCGKDDSVPTPDPITSSDITGSVILYDEGISQLSGDGMTITVEGTSPLKSGISDANGKFIISDVPFGTYTLNFSKTGHGTFKKFGLVHNNPALTDIMDIPNLGQLSTTAITSTSVTVSNNEVTLELTMDPSASINDSRYYRVFFHDEATVSGAVFTSFSETIETRFDPGEFTISATELEVMGFPSGTTVYVRIYGDSRFSNDYEDLDLERQVFPNLNENTVAAVSFVVP